MQEYRSVSAWTGEKRGILAGCLADLKYYLVEDLDKWYGTERGCGEIKTHNAEEITIRDIARLCDVGMSTVSRAINNHPDINPETKQRIMKTIQERGYIPNNSARDLRRVDGKCIAVVVKGISNPLFADAIEIMEKEIKRKKFSMVIRYVNFSENEVDVALELTKEKKLAGVIFLGGYFVKGDKRLQKLKIPFVLSTSECDIDGVPSEKYSTLSVDDEKEGYRMTDYLLQLGHTRIAVLSGMPDDASIGMLRLEGYKRALKEYGIEPDDDLIVHMKPDITFYSMENGYLMTKELLESGKEFSCIFAFSDAMAIGACRAIADVGKSVPGDYSVAGFDGIEMGDYYNPKLTTISQPIDDIARESVEALFEILEENTRCIHRSFEGELQVKESTARYFDDKQI